MHTVKDYERQSSMNLVGAFLAQFLTNIVVGLDLCGLTLLHLHSQF